MKKEDKVSDLNGAAPGDICTSDAQCYGNGVCTSGLCQATASHCGDDQDAGIAGGSRLCPVGQFCLYDKDSDPKSQCAPVRQAGEECYANFYCSFGMICDNKQCKDIGSVAHGEQIGSIQNRIVCQSHYAKSFGNDTYCLEAPALQV